MANKFKKGGIIVGNDQADKHYNFTRKGWKGVVITEVGENPSRRSHMEVRGIHEHYQGAFWLSEEYFDLDIPEGIYTIF